MVGFTFESFSSLQGKGCKSKKKQSVSDEEEEEDNPKVCFSLEDPSSLFSEANYSLKRSVNHKVYAKIWSDNDNITLEILTNPLSFTFLNMTIRQDFQNFC